MCLYIIINILSNSCCGVLRAVVLGSCWTGGEGGPVQGCRSSESIARYFGGPCPGWSGGSRAGGDRPFAVPSPLYSHPPIVRGTGRCCPSVTICLRKTRFLHLRCSWKRKSRLHHLHVHGLKTPLPSGPPPASHLSSGGPSEACGGDAARLLLAVPSAAASSLLLARAARSCSRSSWIFPSSARSSRTRRDPSGEAASSWKRTRRTFLRRLLQGCRGAQLLGRGRRAEWGADGKRGGPLHGPPNGGCPREERGGPGCTSAPSWAAGSAAPPHTCSEPGGFSVWDKGKSEMGGLSRG